MKLLIPIEKLSAYKSRDKKIPCKCEKCHKVFYAIKKKVVAEFNNPVGRVRFCSRECTDKHKHKRNYFRCNQCQKEFIRLKCRYKGKNIFCSQSCSATYNNTHKTKGYRRSKLEIWIEENLSKLYPKLKIHYNRKDEINAELDIYIPSLRIAFELNGIFHYEPIFSEQKLKQTKNNDERKFQACLEQNIELAIIDVSSLEYFKPEKAKRYLNIIIDIISKSLIIVSP